MRLRSVVLTSWISSITSKISWIVGWPWSNHVCSSVSVCNWFYKLIHGPQKQILVFFGLEFWILAWRSNGKIMELFSEIFWEPCIINWSLRNKLQWNFNRNSYIFIQQNAFENVISKMATICLNTPWTKCWRWQFQIYFLEWKVVYFDPYCTGFT